MPLYKPDRWIVRKIKAYDPDLFIKWNDRYKYFEVFRTMAWGVRLITPVTRSIYNPRAPREFVALDERLLEWLIGADSWRSGGSKKHAALSHDMWVEDIKKKTIKKHKMNYDLAKDMYSVVTNFFTTKHKKKNEQPSFKPKIPPQKWIKPDLQSLTNPRVFARSYQNAKLYDFKRR